MNDYHVRVEVLEPDCLGSHCTFSHYVSLGTFNFSVYLHYKYVTFVNTFSKLQNYASSFYYFFPTPFYCLLHLELMIPIVLY